MNSLSEQMKNLKKIQELTKQYDFSDRVQQNATPDLIENDESNIFSIKKPTIIQEQQLQQVSGYEGSGRRIEEAVTNSVADNPEAAITKEIQAGITKRNEFRTLLKNQKLSEDERKNLNARFKENEEKIGVLNKKREALTANIVQKVTVQKEQPQAQPIDNKKQAFNNMAQKIIDDAEIRGNALASEKKILESEYQYKQRMERQVEVISYAKMLLEYLDSIIHEENQCLTDNGVDVLESVYEKYKDFMLKNDYLLEGVSAEKKSVLEVSLLTCDGDLVNIIEQKKILEELSKQIESTKEITNKMLKDAVCLKSEAGLQDMVSDNEKLIQKARTKIEQHGGKQLEKITQKVLSSIKELETIQAIIMNWQYDHSDVRSLAQSQLK